jgi:hypothetical protein
MAAGFQERRHRADTRPPTSGTPVTNVFDCNPRSEVVSADMDGNAYSYDYDNIGNRLSFNREGTQGTQSVAYGSNNAGGASRRAPLQEFYLP